MLCRKCDSPAVDVRIDGAMWCAMCHRPLNDKAVKADVKADLDRITAQFAKARKAPERKA